MTSSPPCPSGRGREKKKRKKHQKLSPRLASRGDTKSPSWERAFTRGTCSVRTRGLGGGGLKGAARPSSTATKPWAMKVSVLEVGALVREWVGIGGYMGRAGVWTNGPRRCPAPIPLGGHQVHTGPRKGFAVQGCNRVSCSFWSSPTHFVHHNRHL